MLNIKKILIDFYDKRTAKKCSASIGDIMNLRGKNIEHNQFLATTRYLDIKDYIENNKQSFIWQNTVSRAAYENKHREKDGNEAFSRLIASYQTKGYDSNSFFVVDENIKLLDGNHRMGMNIYTNNHKINIQVLKRNGKNPDNLDWYLKNKIATEFLHKVYNTYLQVQEWLVETGDTFCCIVPENKDIPELDMMVNVKRTHKYTMNQTLCSNVGGYKFLESGKYVQFTLDNPKYTIENSVLVSKRIKEIELILEERYGKEFVSQIYFSQSCMEAMEVFDKIKIYFLK